MKKMLLTGIAIVIGTVAFAQEAATTQEPAKQKVKFGIKGGANLATLRFSDDEVDDEKMRASFYVGAVVEIPLSKNWYFEPGLTYLNNGAKREETVLGSKVESEIAIQQINLPLSLKWRAGRHFFFKGGGYVGHISSIELKGSALGQSASAKVDKDLYNNIDAGILLGMELETSFGLFFELNANLGLTDIPKENFLAKEMKNTAVQLGVGFKF
ncbi:MAG: porin family protein [Capnocytophaga sp.]|nr:porin family protein [Capnocytophaga sp.]